MRARSTKPKRGPSTGRSETPRGRPDASQQCLRSTRLRSTKPKRRPSWIFILFVTAVSRVVGLIGSIFLLSWLIGDNILKLIFSGIENLIEQFFSVLGLPYLQFPLPTGLLATTFVCIAILSSALYVAFIYYIHSAVVYKLGFRVPMPSFLERRITARLGQGR